MRGLTLRVLARDARLLHLSRPFKPTYSPRMYTSERPMRCYKQSECRYGELNAVMSCLCIAKEDLCVVIARLNTLTEHLNVATPDLNVVIFDLDDVMTDMNILL